MIGRPIRRVSCQPRGPSYPRLARLTARRDLPEDDDLPGPTALGFQRGSGLYGVTWRCPRTSTRCAPRRDSWESRTCRRECTLTALDAAFVFGCFLVCC